MPGGAVVGVPDATRLEAPVTFKAYMMCAFAAFGGIFFGFDSGYINGVLGMKWFIHTFENLVSRVTHSVLESKCHPPFLRTYIEPQTVSWRC